MSPHICFALYTKAYEQTSKTRGLSSITMCFIMPPALLAVSANKDKEKLLTFYWLPKLHRKPYNARFIANSSLCTTTKLSNFLTSCLTTIKNFVIQYCENVYERPGQSLFRPINNSCKVLNKPKSRGFRASSLYDFSTLYNTLSHNLLDTICIRFGSKLYKQIVSIPMGTNCAPLVADLFFSVMKETSCCPFQRITNLM